MIDLTDRLRGLFPGVAARVDPLLARARRALCARDAELADLRAEAERLRAEAEDARRVKAGFLATISHEIRTPLNGVVGMTDLLLGTDLGREQREYAGAIQASAETLLGVVTDILDFSKVEAGRLVLERATFAPRVALEEAVQIVARAARSKRLPLRFEVADDVPDLAVGDAGRLRQVLTNLLANAVKFTERGEVTARVTVEAREGDRVTLRFAVRDTGIGIAPAEHARIFEPFAQADTSATRRHGGTGLGLAISSRLVQQMGGAIGVESEPGRGSAFWFTVPLAARAPDERRHAVPPPAPDEPGASLAPAPVAPVAPPSGPRARVLVADDNLVNLKIAARILEKLGYEVHMAPDGTTALEAFEAVPFDAVLMDCQMPEMDGYEATARIRALESEGTRHTPVIALTANAMPGDRERCLAAGMDDYLAKPVKADTIRATLARWVVAQGET